jgi:multiple sugar transport system substrate-binding protein
MQGIANRRGRSRGSAGLAAICLALIGVLAVVASASAKQAPGPLGVDDGASLSMWTRSGQTSTVLQLLVAAYNKSHKNKVHLTVVPADTFTQKAGEAAGSGQLPDLLVSDVVYAPHFATFGLWADLSSRLKALPYRSKVAQAPIRAGTVLGKSYAVPIDIDTSIIFYNKGLYRAAGLDPNKPPTTLGQMAQQADAITKYGHGNYGTYFAGSCGGCLGFTWLPSMWADGAKVLSGKRGCCADNGTTANFASSTARAVFSIYRQMLNAGDVAPGAKTDNGATWVSAFTKGNIGIMEMPSSTLGSMPSSIDLGVAPIPGVHGGESTFVGGDVVGIGKDSKHAAEAWNFIAWTLSNKTQINIMAKNHFQLVRTDLGANKYTNSDPRLVEINKILYKGQTLAPLNVNAAFNDDNGPWVKLIQDAVFGDESQIASDNSAITAVLTG